MSAFTGWLRSQGNAGAVANAGLLLEQRRREEWIIRSLAGRLDSRAPAVAATAATAAA